ncbi:hypothetical protein FHW69_002905 [Luteibacter sp. Sphag1AF]|uniref:hypothetical protein n=1 Tax=Luteibacter sp. Sphag1AF TaxID=2587031 RepID=UPI00160C0FF4|nr:hypothetical protein [Luteibacter sp. Sphag1AF]MBB3228270.1 hypothetical protein [Luteibacter sp. Sphag1AF]
MNPTSKAATDSTAAPTAPPPAKVRSRPIYRPGALLRANAKQAGKAKRAGNEPLVELLPVFGPEFLAVDPPEGPLGDNLLNSDTATMDIPVAVQLHGSATPGDRYNLRVNKVLVDPTYALTPADVARGTITLPLPASLRADEGTYDLDIQYLPPRAGTPRFGPPTTFIVDKTPPAGELRPGAPGGFDGRLNDGLTQELLTQLGGVIVASLPAYGSGGPGQMAAGDEVTPYVNTIPGTPFVITAAQAGSSPSILMEFTEAQIKAAGDGPADFYYTVRDRAGWISKPSFPHMIDIYLNASITDLVAPIVPAYTSGLVILEEEARTGVLVTIPAHVKVLAGYSVVVIWNGRRQPAVRVQVDNTAFDVVVPYAEIVLGNGGQDIANFDVIYEVLSSNITIGTSPPARVRTNLELPGGEDPDTGTPWHDNLHPAVVHGNSGTANVITPEDSLLPAIITIPFDGVDSTAVFKAGDEIVVRWNMTVIADTKTVTAADVAAGADFLLTITSAEIQAAGSDPALPVTYTVRRLVQPPTGYNTSYSPVQLVNVQSLGDVPGGGDPLPFALSLDETYDLGLGPDYRFVDWFYIPGGIRLELPHYANKAVGDVITVYYTATEVGFQDDWPGIGGPLPGLELTQPATFTVGPDEVDTSSYFQLPEYCLRPLVTLKCTGTIKWSARNAHGTANSLEMYLFVDNRPGGPGSRSGASKGDTKGKYQGLLEEFGRMLRKLIASD